MTFCIACNSSVRGTYIGSFKTMENVDALTVEVTLILSDAAFTIKTKEYKTEEIHKGKYEITEDGKISFEPDRSSDFFPFDNNASYNAEKKTITVKHILFNKTIVLKKR